MRSDKEQLELIIQKKGVAEARRKRNRRLIYSAFSLFLCLAVVLVCVTVSGNLQRSNKENTDGVDIYGDGIIGGASNTPTDPDEYLGLGDGVVDESPKYEYDYDLNGDDVLKPSVPEGFKDTSKTESPETTLQSGTLTAGEIRDNGNYKEWLKAVSEWKQKGVDIEKWGLSTSERITVQTKGAAGAVVELLDAQGKALYGAVTNAKGTAYLFTDGQAAIKTVSVRAGGKTATAEYDGTDYIFDFSNTAQQLNKLDLMFMVDTTGSMGDELEYLKVEIADVIKRISSNNISVRTSVNFYRDEGDEYIVKYHDFRTDSAEVQEIVGQQYAGGGGDYEEAVHTALGTALEMKWEADSVKVMFLILDAPPHSDSEVIDSVNNSIKRAAEQGIRIVPVASSGIDDITEWLLRSVALITGGTYTFLTDTSGVGNSHKQPSAEQYKEERLNDMMVRIALEYCGIDVQKDVTEESSEEASIEDDSADSTDESFVSLSDKAFTVYVIKGEGNSYTVKGVIPAGVYSAKIVVSTGENLKLKEGTLKAEATNSSNTIVNEKYNRNGIKGACTTFAGVQSLPENTVVFEAEYIGAEGAEISAADVYVKEWNLAAETDYIATQDTEQAVIEYVD